MGENKMSGLSAFLANNAAKIENEKYVVSSRFFETVKETNAFGKEVEVKKAIPWEIRALSEAENESLRKQCTTMIPVNKGTAKQEKTDYNKYLGKLVVAATVFPDLHSAELQSSYNVLGADNLIKIMLTPGEYSDYLAKVQEVNGFDKDMDELVEEAKN